MLLEEIFVFSDNQISIKTEKSGQKQSVEGDFYNAKFCFQVIAKSVTNFHLKIFVFHNT